MVANLLLIGVQPSEIEQMTWSRLDYYNQFVEVVTKARQNLALAAVHGAN